MSVAWLLKTVSLKCLMFFFLTPLGLGRRAMTLCPHLVGQAASGGFGDRASITSPTGPAISGFRAQAGSTMKLRERDEDVNYKLPGWRSSSMLAMVVKLLADPRA